MKKINDIIRQTLVYYVEGYSFEFIANEFNITTSTIKEWLKLYKMELKTIETSININKLIAEENFVKAYQESLKDEYADNLIITSQRIDILLSLHLYDLAYKLASKSEFSNDLLIQSQRISALSNIDLDAAIAESEKDEYKDYLPIQSQRISFYIRKKELNKALNETYRTEFGESSFIQCQKINILKATNQFNLAHIEARKPEYRNNSFIQNQEISLLVKERRYLEALIITEKDEFIDIPSIQSLRIKALIELGRYNEALEIANRDIFKNNVVIQNQKVIIYINLNNPANVKEAIKNARTLELNLFAKRINDLITLGFFREALDEINHQKNKKYINEDIIIKYRTIITRHLAEVNNSIEDYFEEISNNPYIDILNKISDGTVDYNELESISDKDINKLILLIAYYEKNKYDKNIIIFKIKQFLINFNDDPDSIEIIQKLLNRHKSKIKIFDVMFYNNLISISTRKVNLDNSISRLHKPTNE